jgi:hypothetical protein
MIADPDTIVIARMDGKNITRGDLARYVYQMDDKDRPRIYNRGDLLRVLNQMIDNRIKLPLGKQMAEAGEIEVPRDAAREEFFKQAGADEQMYRAVWAMEVPRAGEATPLMRQYNLTPETLRAMKDMIDLQTEFILEKIQGETAVIMTASKLVQEGRIKIDDEAVQREYQVRKDSLKHKERMVFRGIRLPLNREGALQEAAGLRQQVDAGADFDAIVEEYFAKDPGLVVESEIENDPASTRFRTFWEQASGAQVGQIIGPVYFPPYQQIAAAPGAHAGSAYQGDSYLLIKVLEIEPERPMSIEEARPLLVGPLAVAAAMEEIRRQHGVEIYEEKVADPAKYRDPRGDVLLGK